MMDVTGNLARWHLRLPEFDFEAFHLDGVKHQAADSTSQLPTPLMDEFLPQYHVSVLMTTRALSKAEKTENGCKNFAWSPL